MCFADALLLHNKSSTLCWFNADCYALSNLRSVCSNVCRVKSPVAVDHPGPGPALAEGVRRVLKLRRLSTLPLSRHSWGLLADCIHVPITPDKPQQEDAFDGLRFAWTRSRNGVFRRIFSSISYSISNTVIVAHAPSCKDFSGDRGAERVDDGEQDNHQPFFRISRGTVTDSLTQLNADAQTPLFVGNYCSYFSEVVSGEDAALKISFFIRCLNAYLNPPPSEVAPPEYPRRGPNCKTCGKLLPKDSCPYCSERFSSQTSKRILTLGPLLVVQFDRISSGMKVTAPLKIRFHRTGPLPGKRSRTNLGTPVREFALKSVIHRRGRLPSGDHQADSPGGHYLARLLLDDGAWIECDDTVIRDVEDQGDPKTATIFFYEDVSVPPFVFSLCE